MFDQEPSRTIDVLVDLGNGPVAVIEADSAELVRSSQTRISRIEIGNADYTDDLAGTIGWLQKGRIVDRIARSANGDATAEIFLALDTSDPERLIRLMEDPTEIVRVYCQSAESERIGEPDERLVGAYRLIIQPVPTVPVRVTWAMTPDQTMAALAQNSLNRNGKSSSPIPLGEIKFENGTTRNTSRFIEITIDVPGPELEQGTPQIDRLTLTDGSGNILGRYVPEQASENYRAGTYAIFGPVDIEAYKNERVIVRVVDVDLATAQPRLRYAIRQPAGSQQFEESIDLFEDKKVELPSLLNPAPHDPDIPDAAIRAAATAGRENTIQSAIIPPTSLANGTYQPIPAGHPAAPDQQHIMPPTSPTMPHRRSPFRNLFGSTGLLGDWRVALLALTGLALSVASGITTWDGMTNFTNNAGLSLLITFGIQGVMLIAAFIIGKTFVDGLRANEEVEDGSPLTGIGKSIGGLLFLTAFTAVLWAFFKSPTSIQGMADNLLGLTPTGSWVAGAIAIIAFVAMLLTAFRNVAAVRPYIGGLSIMAANLPLWAMFLICMAISVFFSFDSLFNQILPQDARVANANIRMQAEVPDLVQSIANETKTQQVISTNTLFEDSAWTAYETELNTLKSLAEQAQQNIRVAEDERIRTRNEQQASKRAIIETSSAEIRRLQARNKSIGDELSGIRNKLATKQSELTKSEAILATRDTELRVAEAAAEAEARGVDGTGKAGRGPAWRALRDEAKKVEFRRDLAASDVKRAKEETAALDAQVKTLFDRQAEIIKQRAKLEGEKNVAEQQSGLSEKLQTADIQQTFSGAIVNLPKLRDNFRQTPTAENFRQLQDACNVLLGGLTRQQAFQNDAAKRDCEPERATAMAQTVFGYNQGLANLKSTCGKLSTTAKMTADELISRGQNCLDSSGLTGDIARPYRDRLKTLKLSRDDQANNFVVTINSFNDGNRLAYLALAIAIAIDILVFMSGLFSARVNGDTGHTSTTLPKHAFAHELRPIGNEISSEANYKDLTDGIRPAPDIPEHDAVWTHYVLPELERRPIVRRIVLAAAAHDWIKNNDGQVLLHKQAWNQILEGREIAFNRHRHPAPEPHADAADATQTALIGDPANSNDGDPQDPEPSSRGPGKKGQRRPSGLTPLFKG